MNEDAATTAPATTAPNEEASVDTAQPADQETGDKIDAIASLGEKATPEPPIAVEFYKTGSGANRARVGDMAQVPNPNGEGTVPKVVAPVLTSESYESLDELGEDLTRAISGAQLPVVIGDAPASFRPPMLDFADRAMGGEPDLGLPREETAIEEPPPSRLLDIEGNELDRKYGRHIDRRAHGILLRLSQGATLQEAVAALNEVLAGGKNKPLTDREGYDLAFRELYKLALYSALVANRSLVPTADQLI
jgi:hypothetical protein